MAGHHHRNRVSTARLRNRPGSLRPVDCPCDIQVRPGFAGWNREELIPYLALEVRALKVEWQRRVELPSHDSVQHRFERGRQRDIVTF